MFVIDKHDGKSQRQQGCRNRNRVKAKMLDAPVTQHGAQHKAQNDAKLEHAVF